jgi:hypothetical protein
MRYRLLFSTLLLTSLFTLFFFHFSPVFHLTFSSLPLSFFLFLSLTHSPGALPAIIAFPWRLRMHETETFERVKQGRADAAERRTAELASDLHSHSHSHSGTSQYGSTDKEAGSGSGAGSGSVPAASAALTVTGSSRMEELKHTYYFYKYHMLGNFTIPSSLPTSIRTEVSSHLLSYLPFAYISMPLHYPYSYS